MADNEESTTLGGECRKVPGSWRCIKGYPDGWRPSKECRYCHGEDRFEWPA